MHYKDFLFEGKTVATVRMVVNAATVCSTYVPVTTKAISNEYDTSELAEIILNGGYRFNTDKGSCYMTADSVSKVQGLGEFLNSKSKGSFKIGSKSYKISYPVDKVENYDRDYSYSATEAKSFIIDVEGDSIDEVKDCSYINDENKDRIKNRQVVNCLKSDLSQTTIDAVYGDKEEVNFYYTITDGAIKVILLSAHDFVKGDFVIFGQQHTSKNERFVFITTDYKYGPINKGKFNTGSYSKSKIYKRADGMFVAK